VSYAAASLIAMAGVGGYVAIYYGALYALRRQREYLAFAGFSGSLALSSAGSAFTTVAPSVADAVPAQQLQFIGLFVASGFFVDFVLHIAESVDRRVIRGTYALAGIGAGAGIAGLLFDPAYAEAGYDFGTEERAIAALSPLGVALTALLLVPTTFALIALFRRARERELRAAALVSALSVLVGAYDLVEHVLDLRTFHLAAHIALLPVLGFSYILIGRFTRVDAQLADRTLALAKSYDHLRLAQEELVKTEQLAAVGELSAVIAHEVRNPLAIIKNAVGGLRRRELAADDADTLLGILDEETDRLNRLVNDLLAYARPIAPEPGHVDLRTLVMHAVELAAGGNQGLPHIEIELDLEREVDLVAGDEALLRHALINIVDNALQAMPEGGALKITCRNTDAGSRAAVAVDFHDTGEGMDTLVRSKARDPFFTTRQTGTGLGLAIVDRVARAHGGRVEIESRHGQGSTVSFIVPRDHATMPPS